jgi:hypothetical protein
MEEKKMSFTNNHQEGTSIPQSKSKDHMGNNLDSLTKNPDGSSPTDYRLDLKSNQDMTKVISESTNNANWYELRFPVLGPDRRGYQSTF